MTLDKESFSKASVVIRQLRYEGKITPLEMHRVEAVAAGQYGISTWQEMIDLIFLAKEGNDD